LAWLNSALTRHHYAAGVIDKHVLVLEECQVVLGTGDHFESQANSNVALNKLLNYFSSIIGNEVQ